MLFLLSFRWFLFARKLCELRENNIKADARKGAQKKVKMKERTKKTHFGTHWWCKRNSATTDDNENKKKIKIITVSAENKKKVLPSSAHKYRHVARRVLSMSKTTQKKFDIPWENPLVDVKCLPWTKLLEVYRIDHKFRIVCIATWFFAWMLITPCVLILVTGLHI